METFTNAYVRIVVLLIFTLLIASCHPATTATPIPPTALPAATNTIAATSTPSRIQTTAPTVQPLTGSGGGVIAFTSERDGNMEIYVMNADGSDQRRLTFDSSNDGWTTWSPDGTHIAYHSVQGGGSILNFLNLADNSIQQWPVPLDGKLWEPAWSHDGLWLAFSNQATGSNSEIYIMSVDGGNLIQLTSANGYDGGPFWSPNDRQIAFYSNRDGNFEVYVMNTDGTDQRRLTENPAEDLVTSWSPDGTSLAFFSDRDGNNEIYTINVDGSNLVRMTDTSFDETYPAWSPDGTRIAFVSDQDGNDEIYVMDANGDVPTRLTNTSARELMPAWRP
jgi:Tol biopolymer transport system component